MYLSIVPLQWCTTSVIAVRYLLSNSDSTWASSFSDILVKPRISVKRTVNSLFSLSMEYRFGFSAISVTRSGGTYCPNKSLMSDRVRDSKK